MNLTQHSQAVVTRSVRGEYIVVAKRAHAIPESITSQPDRVAGGGLNCGFPIRVLLPLHVLSQRNVMPHDGG